MATDTDILLRSRLDGNQRDREQMCRAILALDPHYADVRPRHPSGGPDGGRDIEALLDGELVAYGAIGFVNGANDSDEQKRQVRRKFDGDLGSALGGKADLRAFAFMTNLALTAGEKDELRARAARRGVARCDVLDRERLRIELDSPAGFFIRFQYLNVPLSEAEQASFLSRYGDRIQEVVSTGFQRVEAALARQTFLLEAADVLEGVHVRLALDRPYQATEIGHFRAFVHLALRALKHDILTIWFGASDMEGRFASRAGPPRRMPRSGIRSGVASAQWEQHVKLGGEEDEGGKDADDEGLVAVGEGVAVGVDPVAELVVSYSHDDPLFRLRPRLSLRDLDDCILMPFLNAGLAEKVRSFQVFANGYKLLDIGPDEFVVDRSAIRGSPPGYFSPGELADAWVRLRPAGVSSAFFIRFHERTPRRMYSTREVPERVEPIGERANGVGPPEA